MNQKFFCGVAGVIFLLIAVLHALRVGLSVPIVIDEWTVPLWISYPAAIFFGFLSYTAFKMMHHR